MAPRISILDNEDGTWTASSGKPGDIVLSLVDPGLFTIFNANATYLDLDTYEVSSMTESKRLQLQALLVTLLGSPNVYFQPPPDFKMNYPCIVYHLDDVDTSYGDNLPYSRTKKWNIAVIDRNPDSDIPDKVGVLPSASFDRTFAAGNLNHFVYNLFF